MLKTYLKRMYVDCYGTYTSFVNQSSLMISAKKSYIILAVFVLLLNTHNFSRPIRKSFLLGVNLRKKNNKDLFQKKFRKGNFIYQFMEWTTWFAKPIFGWILHGISITISTLSDLF